MIVKLPSGPHALFAVCVSLFSSGAASLIFETLWFRQASLAFGNSVWASALVTAGFMGGLAVGGLLVSRVRASASQRFATYARLELLIGLAGLTLVHGLPALARVFAPFAVGYEQHRLLIHGARLLASLALLLVPSAAMGMTLPLAIGGLRAWGRSFGSTLGVTYAVNTLGAMTGALLTELVLLSRLGVRGTAFVALGLSLVAALLTFLLSRSAARAERDAPSVASDHDPGTAPSTTPKADVARPDGHTGSPAYWLVAAALAGFAMLGLEVVWLRMLMLFLADTPVAFTMILTLVLGGIALGSLIASILMRASASPGQLAQHAAYVAGAGVTLGLLAFPFALTRFFALEQDALGVLLIALPLVLPTAVASGCVLPLVAAGRAAALGSERDEGSIVLAVNTLGAAVGAALAALWLLPALGMEGSLVLFACVHGVAGVALGLARAPRQTPLRWLALAAFVGVLALFPRGVLDRTYIRGSVSRWMGADDRVVDIREGLTATLVHVRHRSAGVDAFDQLATNSYSMSANDFAGRRYMKLFAYLPLAVHPGMRRALVIGYGLGNTAKALTDTAELTHIDVVDTSPETLAIGRNIHFDGPSPLADPRLSVHFEDGRHYLQGTSARYDLITGEPPPPFLAGVESLYTAEYFALAHDRLDEGGFATYWLPLMNISATAASSIVGAFCSAFADCSLWHGAGENYMLMGSRGAKGPVSLERFVQQWTIPEVRTELGRVGFEHPVQLGALFIGDARYLAEFSDPTSTLSDEFPRRMLVTDPPGERARVLAAWGDTSSARTRFMASPLIATLWPARVMNDSRHQFESQRLLNDLLSDRDSARSLPVLDQLLTSTPWKLPVLLMLASTPDTQKVIATIAQEPSVQPYLRLHRLAERLAERDFSGALVHARELRDEQLPLPGLRTFLDDRTRGKAGSP